MAIDPKKLQNFQKDLDERSSGSNTFINASKIEGSLDFRILDPVPSMDGMYALEVEIWWVGKKKIISPVIFGGPDIVKQMIAEAAAQNDPELNKLLEAKGNFNQKNLRQQTEYWIPGLVFDWKIEGDNIVGIYDANNKIDPNLVDNFIRDKECKILTCKVQLMKAINRVATTRGGSIMFDRVDGFNLLINKTGKERETVYTANKDMAMPMPEKYYGAGSIDVVDICKAGMYTDDYIDAIVAEYLYGEALPEKSDSSYRYPKVRASLKESNDASDAPSRPSRPGRGTAAAPEQEEEEEQPQETPSRAPSRTARTASAEDTKAVTRPSRTPRNVAKDLNDV